MLDSRFSIQTPPRHEQSRESNSAHIVTVSPMHCEYVNQVLGCPSGKRTQVATQIGQHRLLSGSQDGTTLKGLPEYTRWSLPLMERAVRVTQASEITAGEQHE